MYPKKWTIIISSLIGLIVLKAAVQWGVLRCEQRGLEITRWGVPSILRDVDRSISPSPWLQIHNSLPYLKNKTKTKDLYDPAVCISHPSLGLLHLISQQTASPQRMPVFLHCPSPSWLSPSLLWSLFISALSVMTSFCKFNGLFSSSFSLKPVDFYTPAPKHPLGPLFHPHCTFLIIRPLIKLLLTPLPLTSQFWVSQASASGLPFCSLYTLPLA